MRLLAEPYKHQTQSQVQNVPVGHGARKGVGDKTPVCFKTQQQSTVYQTKKDVHGVFHHN